MMRHYLGIEISSKFVKFTLAWHCESLSGVTRRNIPSAALGLADNEACRTPSSAPSRCKWQISRDCAAGALSRCGQTEDLSATGGVGQFKAAAEIGLRSRFLRVWACIPSWGTRFFYLETPIRSASSKSTSKMPKA